MTIPAEKIQLPVLPRGLRADVPRVRNGHFEIRAFADRAVIEIFDAIGSEAVTATRVAGALRQSRGRPVVVQLNSPGGDAFEGVTIYNLLRAHDAPITVQILGQAASAASIVAMAGNRIEVAANAQIMVHLSWFLVIGNAETMREAARVLDQVDAVLAETYAARTGQPVVAVAEMMRRETYLDAGQALELGFADALLERDALPPPQTASSRAPQTRRQLEAELRHAGFSRSEAIRLAAGGWPALAPGAIDPEPVGRALLANIRSLKSLQKGC